MQDVPPFVQYGALGLCALCIWVIYKMQNGQSKRFIDALDRNSTAWTENAKAVATLTEQLRERK